MWVRKNQTGMHVFIGTNFRTHVRNYCGWSVFSGESKQKARLDLSCVRVKMERHRLALMYLVGRIEIGNHWISLYVSMDPFSVKGRKGKRYFG